MVYDILKDTGPVIATAKIQHDYNPYNVYFTECLQTTALFQQVLDETPPDIKLQVQWSYDIADRIEAALRQRKMTQKEFAKMMGTSESAVSHWVGGGHNFKLSTLAKISTVLDEPIIKVVL